jgi:hypothetical protein
MFLPGAHRPDLLGTHEKRLRPVSVGLTTATEKPGGTRGGDVVFMQTTQDTVGCGSEACLAGFTTVGLWRTWRCWALVSIFSNGTLLETRPTSLPRRKRSSTLEFVSRVKSIFLPRPYFRAGPPRKITSARIRLFFRCWDTTGVFPVRVCHGAWL